MLHLILGTDWTANRDEILRRISVDVRHKKQGRILMVPELISHDMERRLCAAAGDTASRYAEVLSFTRLARRVSESVGAAAMECLDNGGRVVAMAAAARQLHSKLKAYASVETRPEFLTGLLDAVDEFKRCCITPETLMSASRALEGNLAQKLEELSLLMEGYDALCSRGKRDPRDQMTWCLEQMEEGDFARNHVFYVDGFPDFTRQHLAILEHLIRESPEVTVSLNCDDIGSQKMAFEKAADTARQILDCARRAGVKWEIQTVEPRKTGLHPVRKYIFQGQISEGKPIENLRTFRAETPYMECMGAARQVMEQVRQGSRYRDFTIVCTDMNTYGPLLKQVFRRMGIPVYQSGTEEILSKSVIATVLNALDAALSGFEQGSVLRYLRSALSPLDMDTCDQVENYGIIWGIRGQKWLQTWENHPDGLSAQWSDGAKRTLERLNRARELAMEPLDTLRREFLQSSDLRGQVLALYSFLETIQMEKQLASMAESMDAAGDNRGAQILNQLWEILISALEQMYDTLGDTVWEPEHFVRLLRLLLSQYDVGTIPPVLDAVQVGPVSAMRCHQQKYLLVLGAQEGNLPGYSGSTGVLTDQERELLRQMDAMLTGGAMEGIRAEFAEIYGVFCGATEGISVSYIGEQPSFVFRRLSELSGKVEVMDAPLGFAPGDPEETGAYLARWDQTDTARSLGVEDAYLRTWKRKNYTLGQVEKDRIDQIYGTTLNLSASQIEMQAMCRTKYFLRYGIRVNERKEASVDPAEFGTYIHAVLENTCRCIRDMGGFQKVSLEETMEIAHRYSQEYAAEHFSQLDSQRMQYLFRRNGQELDVIVRELWEELKDSLFEPRGFELNFGIDDGLPGIAIPNNAMNAVLRGLVDRMDAWDHNGNTYYRVVDYKTGQKDFDYCDVFFGVGLQMLLYMFALRNSGEESLGSRPVPAGVLYFPARAPYLSADGRLEDADADKLRAKVWKRQGLLLEDQEVLDAMESGEASGRLCYSVKKDGTLTGNLASREQLKMLETYIFQTLGRLVEQIASGDVSPNPYTRGNHGACTYCPYGSICHKEEVENRRNYKTMQPDRFWAEIEKELKENGG